MLVLVLMAAWSARTLNVKGAFPHELFEDGEDICMKVPKVFEKHHHAANIVLLLLRVLAVWPEAERLCVLEAVAHGLQGHVLLMDKPRTCSVDILG
jgi:hypothetical protein